MAVTPHRRVGKVVFWIAERETPLHEMYNEIRYVLWLSNKMWRDKRDFKQAREKPYFATCATK